MTDVAIQTPLSPDTAFSIYYNAAQCSYLKFAEITGVPLHTVRYWASSQRWKDQADTLELQARRANRAHVLSRLDTEMPSALGKIQHLMTEAKSEKVQLEAARSWVELWGKYRVLVSEDDAAAADTDDDAAISDAELFAVLKRVVHHR